MPGNAPSVRPAGRYPQAKLVRFLPLFFILVLLAGSTACSKAFAAPPAANLQQSPPIVNAQDLVSAYTQNPVEAAARYKDQRVYLTDLTVTLIARRGDAIRAPDNSVVAGLLRFTPRYTEYLNNVVEGTTIEVVGKVQGISWGYLVITDCWIHILGGAGNYFPGY